MILSQIFTQDFICIDCQSDFKDELFEELVSFLCNKNHDLNAQELTDSLNIRENAMSTGVIANVAIPHARTDAVDEICGAIGIAKNGVDYGAFDGKPVKLIFMFFAPNSRASQYLRMINRLAKLLENRNFINAMIASTSAESAFNILRRAEKALIESDADIG